MCEWSRAHASVCVCVREWQKRKGTDGTGDNEDKTQRATNEKKNVRNLLSFICINQQNNWIRSDLLVLSSRSLYLYFTTITQTLNTLHLYYKNGLFVQHFFFSSSPFQPTTPQHISYSDSIKPKLYWLCCIRNNLFVLFIYLCFIFFCFCFVKLPQSSANEGMNAQVFIWLLFLLFFFVLFMVVYVLFG